MTCRQTRPRWSSPPARFAVTGARLTWLTPAATRPSAESSPGQITTSPTRMSSTPRAAPTGCDGSLTSVGGARSISARIDARARPSRAPRAAGRARTGTTAAPSDHCPSTIAPATATSISVDGERQRTRRVQRAPHDVKAAAGDGDTNGDRDSAIDADDPSAIPAAVSTPESTTNSRPVTADGAAPGSSCEPRHPVCATASEMIDVLSFAASYLIHSRCPRCPRRAPRPVNCFSFFSRIATSSWQSIPSILNVDSAWSSQTWQAATTRLPQPRGGGPAGRDRARADRRACNRRSGLPAALSRCASSASAGADGRRPIR